MSTAESPPKWYPPPVFHLRPLRGWMNDPCAPGYDVSTGTYHLFYQWNPKHCDWGDITWGQYTSKDGLRWSHSGLDPVLKPSEPYDRCGIFTGCFHSAGPHGEQDQLSVFYTSANHLPINWALPYTRNSEGLAMATSLDEGRTWIKSELNPILCGEPEGLTVTGWRDPFVAEWPALDQARGVSKTLYGIISGGILGTGPALFLYTVQADDLSHWDYLGPLVHFTEGSYRPTRWTGNYGVNWECGNFMTLGDGSEELQFLMMGSEGGVKPNLLKDASNPYGSWLLWMSGDLKQTESGPKLIPEIMGLVDHGIFYAASSYEHPTTKKRIVWGWLKEDTLALDRREAKGWAGFQSLPRELFLCCLPNVIGALKTPLEDISSLKVKLDTNTNTKTIYTLGIRPLPGIESLRRGGPKCWDNFTNNAACVVRLATCRSTSYEIEAVIQAPPPGSHRVGFHLRHSDDLSRRLSVYFDAQAETIVLDRSQTNEESGTPKEDLSGPFTLFKQTDRNGGAADWERLHLRIFGDGDTIEVFANDRFALSGVAYLESGFTNISSFVEGPDGPVLFEKIRLWDDITSCLV